MIGFAASPGTAVLPNVVQVYEVTWKIWASAEASRSKAAGQAGADSTTPDRLHVIAPRS